jgi:hypothetical protein
MTVLTVSRTICFRIRGCHGQGDRADRLVARVVSVAVDVEAAYPDQGISGAFA